MFNDLREFIAQVGEIEKVKLISGADWNLEIGYISELATHAPDSPLLVFDDIKGYPHGYRIVTNVFNSSKRLAMILGFPTELKGLDLVRAFRQKMAAGFKPVKPLLLKDGPSQENVHTGNEVDLFEFPTPKWHVLDGGRYIGTGHMVIQKDPDTGWVNFGTYRMQILDKATTGIHIVPGRHGDIIARKYWEKGLNCPAVAVCGEDPLLYNVSTTAVPLGVSEFDYAGWLRGKPEELIKARTVDLPVPASAEIVLEGEILPPEAETRIEGPFGEWEGYYGGGARPHPIFKVKAISHRNDPIIHGAPPIIGPFDNNHGMGIRRSASLWDELDKNLPGVKGVWQMEAARGPLMTVVSLRQQYPGHAKQAALVAAGALRGAANLGRIIVIVDEDIDPSNISDVLWALGTRWDPQTATDIIGNCWGISSDPRLEPEKRAKGDFSHSKALILACKPYNWIGQFPASIKSPAEVLEKVREKWGDVLFG